MRLTVLGAGAYGSALAHVLELNHHEPVFYSLEYNTTLKDALKGAEMQLIVLPSKAIPELLPKLPKDLPLIVASKGITDPNMFQEFADVLAISGAGYGGDILKHKPTKLTASDPRIDEIFGTDWLTFDHTNDIKGMFICGSLKNIYAIDAGRKNIKQNTKEFDDYIKEVAIEFKAILEANNAKPDTFDLSCGIDDLRLTCNYPSRNYEFGQILIINPDYKPKKTVEGVTALKRIKAGELDIPESAKIMQSIIKESEKWD